MPEQLNRDALILCAKDLEDQITKLFNIVRAPTHLAEAIGNAMGREVGVKLSVANLWKELGVSK